MAIGRTVAASAFLYIANLQLYKIKQELKTDLEKEHKSFKEELDLSLEKSQRSLETSFKKQQKTLEKDLDFVQRELFVAKQEVKMERGQDIKAALFSFELANNEARQKQLRDQDARAKEEFDKIELRVSKLEKGQAELQAGQAELQAGQAELQAGQAEIKTDIAEIKTDIAAFQDKIMAELQKINSK